MTYFSAQNYYESRELFCKSLPIIQSRWPNTQLETHQLPNTDEDLTIDVIYAAAAKTCENCVLIFTGLHGVEGYLGSAFLQLFIKEYLPILNPENTSVFLVHILNPWGMKYLQRINENNVDLNRNFILDWHDTRKLENQEYMVIQDLIEKLDLRKPLFTQNIKFGWKLIKAIWNLGIAKFAKKAILSGQYQEKEGVFYGGTKYEFSTQVAIDLCQRALKKAKNVVCFDVHSGYGPRYQMTLFNSPHEIRSLSKLQDQFNYPKIETPYTSNGDIIDYIYLLKNSQYKGVNLYAVCLEYGTVGESYFQGIKMLRNLVFQNRINKYPQLNTKLKENISNQFLKGFYPRESKWQQKVIKDTHQALKGIFSYTSWG